MDVYLIPTLSPERYELYYEPPDEEEEEEEDERSLPNRWTFGLYGRLRRSFSAMLLEAEEWRHRRHEARPTPGGFMTRMRRKMMGFIVERIAEQRLLWHMRRATEVCACIPADLSESDADAIIRPMLKKDHDRHRKWLIIDGLLLVPAAALTVVPGPNVLGLYFTFQVVSHFLSWSGAKNGLAISPWTFKASADLAELRTALTLPAPQRQRRFHEVARRLRLEHLPTFLDDVATQT